MPPTLPRSATAALAGRVLHAPHLARDAAAVMGHGPEVSLTNYNMATAVEALRRHAKRISRLKQETAGVAARAFGWPSASAAGS
jgi:hypothetical protein